MQRCAPLGSWEKCWDESGWERGAGGVGDRGGVEWGAGTDAGATKSVEKGLTRRKWGIRRGEWRLALVMFDEGRRVVLGVAGMVTSLGELLSGGVLFLDILWL